jgi:hypothetical protein
VVSFYSALPIYRYQNFYVGPINEATCPINRDTMIVTLGDLIDFWDEVHDMTLLNWELGQYLEGTLSTPQDPSTKLLITQTSFRISANIVNPVDKISEVALSPLSDEQNLNLVLCPTGDKNAPLWKLVMRGDAMSASELARFVITLGLDQNSIEKLNATKALSDTLKLDSTGQLFKERFPELAKLTSHLRSLSLDDLGGHLSDLSNNLPEQLEIFGAKIPVAAIPLLGGGLLFGLQLYMIANFVALESYSRDEIE